MSAHWAPALAKLSALELRPNEIIAHTTDLENAMRDVLSAKWSELRGLTVTTIALNPISLPEEDAQLIKTRSTMRLCVTRPWLPQPLSELRLRQ